MSEVIINLQQSRDAKVFEENQIIHRQEYQFAKLLIYESYEKALKEGDDEKFYSHETITILGTRGSGKTTFLLSLLNNVRNESINLTVPEIIDPTLIEEKGHIFLSIISTIKILVDEHYYKKNDDSTGAYGDWEKALNKLSRALPSVDGVGGNMTDSSWQDPEFILEDGIQSVSAALSLRNDFKTFVQKSLDFLGSKCFLIAFDDIDVDFKKGWPVLETIRKYFSSSKIITILSGDLRFYSLAIRKQHWTNFGKALLLNEGTSEERKNYFDNLVTEMESQYLLKLLKPIRRIYLSTLYEKINLYRNQTVENYRHLDTIKIVGITRSEDEIFEHYLKLLRNVGIVNQTQAEAYYNYLLALPLRTQIQFLSQFDMSPNNVFITSPIGPFLSDLFEKRVNSFAFENDFRLLNVEILKLLINEKVLASAYQLQPTTSDPSLNGCLMAFTILSNKSYKESGYYIFDYFIKIGLIKNLSSSLNYANESRKVQSLDGPNIEGLIWHSSLYQDRVLRDAVGHIISYLIGAMQESDKPWVGLIPILSLEEISKEGEVRASDRIDVVFRKYPLKRLVGFMPLSISSYLNRNSSHVSYSIFSLLAGIGECIRKFELGDLPKGLAELSQVLTFPIPDFGRGDFERSPADLFVESEEEPADILAVTNIFSKWAFNKRPKMNLSPHLLGKIITRFYFALQRIQETEPKENLGKMMHSRVIAFCNSVLVEEAREVDTFFNGFNINNAINSDNIFLSNIKNAYDRLNTKFTLSNWLLSCPFLIAFVNPQSEAYDRLISLTEVDEMFQSELNVYDLLTEVSIRGENRITKPRVPTRLTNLGIAQILKEANVPFEWFKENPDRSITRENNERIRYEFAKLLPNRKNWSSSFLRGFRRFLKAKKMSW